MIAGCHSLKEYAMNEPKITLKWLDYPSVNISYIDQNGTGLVITCDTFDNLTSLDAIKGTRAKV